MVGSCGSRNSHWGCRPPMRAFVLCFLAETYAKRKNWVPLGVDGCWWCHWICKWLKSRSEQHWVMYPPPSPKFKVGIRVWMKYITQQRQIQEWRRRTPPQRGPILSFWHKFPSKSARIRGRCPLPQWLGAPLTGNPGSAAAQPSSSDMWLIITCVNSAVSFYITVQQ